MTRLEVLFCVGSLAIVLLIGFLALLNHGVFRTRIECAQRLHTCQISMAGFAHDHAGHYPLEPWNGQPMNAAVHFQAFSNYLYVPWLVCPNDNRLPALSWESLDNTNISYFINRAASPAKPSAVLLGDRNLLFEKAPNGSGFFKARWNSQAGLHGEFGNLIFVDGHLERKSPSSRLAEIATQQMDSQSEWLVP